MGVDTISSSRPIRPRDSSHGVHASRGDAGFDEPAESVYDELARILIEEAERERRRDVAEAAG